MNSEKNLKPKSRIPVPVSKYELKRDVKEDPQYVRLSQKQDIQTNPTRNLAKTKTKEPNGRKQVVTSAGSGSKFGPKMQQPKISEGTKTSHSRTIIPPPRPNITGLEKGCIEPKTKTKSEVGTKSGENGPTLNDCASNGGKENKLPVPSHIAAQKDIHFKAEEKFKKMLLSERPFSPNMQKHGKLSYSCERPSIYKAPILSSNPLKELLDACSSIKRARQASSLRPLQITKPINQPSPISENFHFLTPNLNPKEEVLRSLAAIKQRKKINDSKRKKVTFNLNVEKFSPLDNSFGTAEDSSESSLEIVPKQSSSEQSSSSDVKEISKTDDKALSSESMVAAKDIDPELKIYTPLPVSMHLNSKTINFSSPDFVYCTDRKLLKESAPISTPLVLKSLTYSMSSPEADLSPVRLKLEFADEDKNSPRIEGPIKNCRSFPLDGIETVQKKQDDLADKECHHSLLNENISVISGRCLQNPVAAVLTEGDEMHYIPIKF